MTTTATVIDGDGHVFEDSEVISSLLPEPYRSAGPWPAAYLFPPPDHLHVQTGRMLPGSFGGSKPFEPRPSKRVGPTEWLKFIDDVGVELSVLYPTAALACGKFVDLDWAIAVCQAYNDWLHQTYLTRSDRCQGMAIIPLQDPAAAAVELRRAVTELGMRGAILPSANFQGHIGGKQFRPIFEEANRLRCAIAFHGGAHSGFGFDDINVYAPAHALGHPFGQLTCFASVIFNGLLNRFPDVHWGFLERANPV